MLHLLICYDPIALFASQCYLHQIYATLEGRDNDSMLTRFVDTHPPGRKRAEALAQPKIMKEALILYNDVRARCGVEWFHSIGLHIHHVHKLQIHVVKTCHKYYFFNSSLISSIFAINFYVCFSFYERNQCTSTTINTQLHLLQKFIVI